MSEMNIDDSPITFDDILTDKEYQAEFDRRVSKALETAKANWEKEAEAKKTEADKLAKMDADEKHKFEMDKMDKERKDALAKLNAYELKEQAVKMATEKGVNISLLDVIDYTNETAETVKKKVDDIAVAFNKAVEQAINDRFKQSSPKHVDGSGTSRKDVSRISI